MRFLFTSILLVLLVGCKNINPHHIPKGKAAYSLTIQVPSPDNDLMSKVMGLLNNRMRYAGITYKSMDVDDASGAIELAIIDAPNAKGDLTSFFNDVLIRPSNLGFWDVYSFKDESMATAAARLMENISLTKLMELQSGNLGLEVIAIAEPTNTPMIDSLLQLPDIKAIFPNDAVPIWSKENTSEYVWNGKAYSQLYLLKTNGETSSQISEKGIIKLAMTPSEYNPGTAEINMQFDEPSTRLWAEMTEKAATDQNRAIAIVLDDVVMTAPVVMNAITSGNSMITGNFSVEEAAMICDRIRTGMLRQQPRLVKVDKL